MARMSNGPGPRGPRGPSMGPMKAPSRAQGLPAGHPMVPTPNGDHLPGGTKPVISVPMQGPAGGGGMPMGPVGPQ